MKNKALITILKTAVTLAIVYFLVDFIIKNWNKIDFSNVTINYLYLLLAAPIIISHLFIYSALWRRTLGLIGVKLSLADTNIVYSGAQFWRYLPGRVLLFVRRVWLCSNKGILKEKAVASVALEFSLLIISAIVLSAITAIFMPIPTRIKIIYLPIVLITLAIIIHPKVLNLLINLGFRLTKKEWLRIRYTSVLYLITAHILTWVLQSMGFYLIISAVYNANLILLPISIWIFTVSWLVGFLGLLTPGGLGIREGIMILLASPFMPASMIIVAALIVRIYITLAEVIFWATTRALYTKPKIPIKTKTL